LRRVRVLLYRVDDRLIHGQVVLGWGRRLGPEGLLVVDDRIAGDAWERDLLGAAAPPETPASFLAVPEAVRALSSGDDPRAVFVLMESARTAVALAEAGFLVPVLNLGGVHRQGGRPVTPYLFLVEEELTALRQLVRRGVEIYAQDVPDGRRVDADSFLDG
jgi:mannose/fructose/N-acetylgalactosamine-specific phosphotransferase system component IIB